MVKDKKMYCVNRRQEHITDGPWPSPSAHALVFVQWAVSLLVDLETRVLEHIKKGLAEELPIQNIVLDGQMDKFIHSFMSLHAS